MSLFDADEAPQDKCLDCGAEIDEGESLCAMCDLDLPEAAPDAPGVEERLLADLDGCGL